MLQKGNKTSKAGTDLAAKMKGKADLLVEKLAVSLSRITSNAQRQVSRAFFEEQLKAILQDLKKSDKKAQSKLGAFMLQADQFSTYSNFLWNKHTASDSADAADSGGVRDNRPTKKQKTRESVEQTRLLNNADFQHALKSAANVNLFAPLFVACASAPAQELQPVFFNVAERMHQGYAFSGVLSHARPLDAHTDIQLLLQEMVSVAQSFEKAPATRESLVRLGESIYRMHCGGVSLGIKLEHPLYDQYAGAMVDLLLRELLLTFQAQEAKEASEDTTQRLITRAQYLLGNAGDPHGTLLLLKALLEHSSANSFPAAAASVVQIMLRSFSKPRVPMQGVQCLRLALTISKVKLSDGFAAPIRKALDCFVEELAAAPLAESLASWAATVGISTFAELFDKVSPIQLQQAIQAHGKVEEPGNEDDEDDEDDKADAEPAAVEDQDDLFFMDTSGDIEARKKMNAELSTLMTTITPEANREQGEKNVNEGAEAASDDEGADDGCGDNDATDVDKPKRDKKKKSSIQGRQSSQRRR